jgi:tryptophan halogenase
MFDAENYLYVLYGMKYKTKPSVLTAGEIDHSSALIKSNDELVGKAAKGLLRHRDWLMGLRAAMSGG